MVKTVPRVTIQENGNGEKHESRAALRALPLSGGKVAETKPVPRKSKNKKWADMTAEEKKKNLEYGRAWRAKKRLLAVKTPLPYPFKYCPDCSHAMPTVTHNNRTYLRPCNYCPDCGYQIPVMPKVRRGWGGSRT